MQCEEVREQFAAHVANRSGESVHSEITEHLRTCESCRLETKEMTSLWTALGSITTPEPGREARERFDLMLEVYRHGVEQTTPHTFWHGMNTWIGSWWPRQPAMQFGLAALLVGLGIAAGASLRPAQSPAAVQPGAEMIAMRNELMEMRQMVALSLMQQQSASDRLRGVNWSYQLQQPGQEVLSALLDTLMHDSNVNVRLATVDALRQFGNQPIVRRGVIEALNRPESPMVQVALIGLAVDLHEKESIGALRRLSGDQSLDIAVRERAQKGLAELE